MTGLGIGCLSAVLISINNLRDVDEDRSNAKNTLAVKWGRDAALNIVLVISIVAYACAVWLFGAGLHLLYFLPALLLGALIMASIYKHPAGKIYNKFLAMSALQLILYALAFTVNCSAWIQ